MRLDPKWHSKDRFILLNEKGVPQAYLLLKLRKEGVGVQFGIHEYTWCEAIMEDWDENAVVSCLIMCAFSGCVPFARQRRVLGYHELKNETPLSVQELKDIQIKIRKDCSGLKLPPVLNQAVSLLKERYGELDGLDVKEKIQELSPMFKFLLSKDIPFERICQAWDEAKVSEIMEE